MAGKGEKLLYKTDYLEEILDLFDDGIYITDNEANTVYLNHSYERISGLTVTDMLGKNMKDLVENGVISMSGTLKVLRTGQEVTMEQSFSTGRHAIITSIPIFRNHVFEKPEKNADEKETIVMVVTIVREMTEIYSVRKEMRIQEHLKQKYQAELEKLKKEYIGGPDIVAEDASMRSLMHLVDHIRMVDANILLLGEHGSGKRRIATYIHEYSQRSNLPFLRISFSAMPKDDPMGYLFGQSGEGNYRIGMLENAEGGTVYFEDLEDMPAAIQDQILSLISDGQCVMGDGTVRKLDLRVIAGSTCSMEEMRKMKRVNPDILYAFSMFAVNIPPLRERKADIVPLTEHFLERYNKEKGTNIRVSKTCYERMLAYSWPGNVLELENMVNRAAIVCQTDTIEEEDLFISASEPLPEDIRRMRIPDELPQQMDLRDEVAALEAGYMKKAFEQFGNIRDAAAYLGFDASTFTRKRQKYMQMGLM